MTNVDGYVDMWHIMEALQTRYLLTQQMINAILRNVDANNTLSTIEEEVKNYLEKGADADGMPGASMLRPLHAAAKTGRCGVMKILLRAGADVNTIDAFNNRSPLHYAAEANLVVVKLLLKYNAFPDAKDADGNTPLHWACYKNKVSCVKCLLQSKASVNAVNVNRDTPLSFATMKGNAECVQTLLEFGADARLRNNTGKTALIRAATMLYGELNSYNDNLCFDLLLRATGRLTLKEYPEEQDDISIAHSDRDMYNFLVNFASQVPTLVTLCRVTIRHTMVGRYMPDAIGSLRLPRDIKDFLLLHDSR